MAKFQHVQPVIDFLNHDFNAPVSTWKNFPYDLEMLGGLIWAKQLQAGLRSNIEGTLKAPRKAAIQRLLGRFNDPEAEVFPELRVEAVRSGQKGRVLDFGDE